MTTSENSATRQTHFEVVASSEKEILWVTENTVTNDEKSYIFKPIVDIIIHVFLKWSTLISLTQIIFMVALIVKFGIAPEEENTFVVSLIYC